MNDDKSLNGFHMLPTEMVLLLLTRLRLDDLRATRLTCKRWNLIVDQFLLSFGRKPPGLLTRATKAILAASKKARRKTETAHPVLFSCVLIYMGIFVFGLIVSSGFTANAVKKICDSPALCEVINIVSSMQNDTQPFASWNVSVFDTGFEHNYIGSAIIEGDDENPEDDLALYTVGNIYDCFRSTRGPFASWTEQSLTTTSARDSMIAVIFMALFILISLSCAIFTGTGLCRARKARRTPVTA
eukprot:TRINITY_DN3176_c0_g1_i1.p1 TRINITY_DN3176_c0_g1~~TRINITY_DN3176_c0_g1_i1.p1  ORF type:complete len:243 (+),score=2.08 TRINITY_DN3176_c0_g1_i1:85-813(+)